MLSIRTVLCPVDFSAATARQVDLAVDLCRAFGARLVFHHNVVAVAIGSGVGWMWAQTHPDTDNSAEQKLRGLLNGVPEDVPADVRLTHGPITHAIMEVAAAVKADVAVLGTHGSATDDDESVTDRVLARATIPVLAIHEALHDHATPQFVAPSAEPQPLLVPTDLEPASHAALDLAMELVRRFRFDVHVLHVLTDPAQGADARARIADILPLDLPRRPTVHVEAGVPAKAIARVADQIGAVCIVMGEHVRRPLRHWFRPDASLGVLHRAPCPIWYVPEPKPQPDATVNDARPKESHGRLIDEPQARTARGR